MMPFIFEKHSMQNLKSLLPAMIEDANNATKNKTISQYHRTQGEFATQTDEMMINMLKIDKWIPMWNRASHVDTAMEEATTCTSAVDNLMLPLEYRNKCDYKDMHSIAAFMKEFDNVYSAGLMKLHPGVHAHPHRDMQANIEWPQGRCIRICNIPLITNDRCTMQCGDITHHHKIGEWIDFDPRDIHHARNDGDSDRVILAFSYLTSRDDNDLPKMGCI
jgi:chorismate mutase